MSKKKVERCVTYEEEVTHDSQEDSLFYIPREHPASRRPTFRFRHSPTLSIDYMCHEVVFSVSL